MPADTDMAGDLEDPWRVTGEQLEYYTHQFQSLQPDLGALVLGADAKNFFTKSKLPIIELSHIWELSDLDRDGALTFSEFCVAFHLIVARKHGYRTPKTLPQILLSSLKELNGGEDLFSRTMSPTENLQMCNRTGVLISFEDTEVALPENSAATQGLQDEAATHGMKDETSKPDAPVQMDSGVKPKTRQRSFSSTTLHDKKTVTQVPPAPPPQPHRASSLDLNKLFQQSRPESSSGCEPSPGLPTRTAQKEAILQKPQQTPAQKKHRLESQTSTTSTISRKRAQRLSSKQEIQMAIDKNKETNALLVRLNGELQQQLKEIQQEKLSLQGELDILRSVTFL